MSTYERILVALHDREQIGTSLEKAARLERFTGASVTIAQTCWDVVSEEPAYHFPQEEIDSITSRMKAAELNNLSASIAHYRERIAQLHAEVLWSKHHGEAIARYALETGADLIVAPRHDPALLERVFLPEELKLAAHAHTPLLLTSDEAWPERVNVLAAMDVLASAHAALNARLLSEAQGLATALGGELHLVSVDPASSSSAVPVKTQQEFRTRRVEALNALAKASSYTYAGLHVEAGQVDTVLRDLAQAHELSIVVMGTAARTGLQRLFVGNTAETVLNRLSHIDLMMIPSERG